MSTSSDNPEVDYERIIYLYGNARYGYIGVAAAMLSFGFIIWTEASPAYALTWAGAISIAYIPRAILSKLFQEKVANQLVIDLNVKVWERYFFIASILPFLLFSSAVLLPYGDATHDAILYYAVIVMLLLSGGILTYSTSLPNIILYMAMSVLPLVAKCFWLGGTLFTALGVSLSFSFFLLLRLIPKLNKLLLENISLKIENRHHSLTDPLTKLGNRRRLRIRMDDLMPATRRSKEPFSIILLDIDHFKKFNDTNGHRAGDQLLVKVADILTECSRDQDLVVRYGGEEFLLVLPAADIEDAVVLTERILKAIRTKTKVTMSAGVAMHSGDMEFDEMVQIADQNLYAAKKNGRDTFVVDVTN